MTAAEQKRQVIDAIERVCDLLSAYSEHRHGGRPVELIVRDDGEISLMHGDANGGCFDEAERFENVAALMDWLGEKGVRA